MGKRGNREGSIYRDADGRWRGAVWLGWREGCAWRKMLSGATRDEVRQKVNKALREVDAGIPAVPERLTVSVFLDRWLEAVKQNVRPRTADFYDSIVRIHLKPGLGRLRLRALGPDHVERLLGARIRKGYSAGTAALIRKTLRAALGRAMRWGLVERNAAALAEPVHERRREQHVLTAKQLRALLEAVRGHRNEALYVAGAALGLREGELLGLRVKDYDQRGGRLLVRKNLQRVAREWVLGDTKRPRSAGAIELPRMVRAALDRKLEVRAAEKRQAGEWWMENGLVFTTPVGGPIHRRDLLREFHGELARAGLPVVRFHDLRHSAATLLLADGVDPLAVKDLLGHANIRTTLDVYAHVLTAMRKDVARKVDARLGRVASRVASRGRSGRVAARVSA